MTESRQRDESAATTPNDPATGSDASATDRNHESSGNDGRESGGDDGCENGRNGDRENDRNDGDGAQRSSVRSRLQSRGHSVTAMHVFLLGLLSIPGYLFDPLAFLRLFALFFLAAFWPFVAPLLGMLRSSDDADDGGSDPRGWLQNDDETREHLTFLLMLPATMLNPPVMVQDLWQAVGGAVAYVRHRGSLPTAETYEQTVSYRLPFEGTWTVVNGSPVREHSHSWMYVNQRYAYDFLQTDEEGRSRPEGSPARVDEYYCYGDPILAPADGTVVDAYDASLESDRAGGFSHPLKGDIRGNYVVIRHAPEEYSSLVHLQPGSVSVEPGDAVEQGQQVGRCGHSGNSSEPHLHFQIQDHPRWTLAATLPVQFDDVHAEWPGDPAAAPPLPDGAADEAPFSTDGPRERAFVTAGQRVTPTAPARERLDHADNAEAESPSPDDRDADGSATTVDDAPTSTHDGRSHSTARIARTTLGRAGFGLGIGGAVAFFGTLLVSASTIAAALGVGTLLAVAYAARSGIATPSGRLAAGRFLGVAGGLAVATGVLAAPGALPAAIDAAPRSVGPVLFAVGFAIHVAVGTYDGWRLSEDARVASGS